MEIKTIGIACDHAGYALKKFVIEYLESHNMPYKDYGTYSDVSWTPEISQLVRQHNDANVLVMPGRFIDNKTAEKIMDEFFRTPFEGGRHAKRVEMIDL